MYVMFIFCVKKAKPELARVHKYVKLEGYNFAS